jgi:dihydroxyacid dehydratase/phosphogluconate dehydratase
MRSPSTASTIGEKREGRAVWNREVIRDYQALVEHGGIAVLRGNLCPDGACSSPRPPRRT